MNYNATQVANEVGVCVQTIDRWYKWGHLNPDNELAQLLPEYQRGGVGRGGSRLWTPEAVEKLKEFKQAIPKGKGGVMGEVTQKYIHKN